MIKWFKRWFMCEPEIVKCDDRYLVRVTILFISRYLDCKDYYPWVTFDYALTYASFGDIDSARDHLDKYKFKFKIEVVE